MHFMKIIFFFLRKEGKRLDWDKDLVLYIINVLQYRDDLDEELKRKKEKINEEKV